MTAPVLDLAVDYDIAQAVRVITFGSQYYNHTGVVLEVSPHNIAVAIEGDVVLYTATEIRRVH